MKVLLEIKEKKAAFVMELLSNFKFVKVKEPALGKHKVLEELKEAVEEVKQIKAGKKKGQPLSELLNEL